MNSDVKRTNVDNENKNCKNLVPPKEPVELSVLLQRTLFSSNATEEPRLRNKTSERTNRNRSMSMTKRFCCDTTEENAQIQLSSKNIHYDKHCTGKFDKAAVKKPRNGSPIKQDEKKSIILFSNKKSNDSISQKQSALIDGRETSTKKFVSHVPKKFSYKAIGRKNSPKAKETCCKNIQSTAKSVVDRTTRNENETATVDREQKISRIKKYSVQANVKHKTELNEEKINNVTDGLKKLPEKDKISARGTINGKNSLRGKTTCNNDSHKENNGAARTRVFQRKKRSEVDNNKDNQDGKKTENSKSKLDVVKPPLEKMNTKRHEIDNDKSIKNNSKQNSIDSFSSTTSDDVVSLFQRGLSTQKSTCDADRFQEFGENYTRSIEEGVNGNSSLEVSIGSTGCKTASPANTDVDISRTKAKKNNEKESTTDPIPAVHHDRTEMIKSQTASQVSSVLPYDITYRTNLTNYRYHSDQRYRKGTIRENRDEKYVADEVVKSIKKNETRDTHGDDAKYNLMKALIHPATEIPDFKGMDNSFTELSESGQKSESVLAHRDEGLENYYGNFSSKSSMMAGITPSPSNDVQQLANYAKNSNSIDSLNSHASTTHLRQSPISQTSDYDTTNLKMKGCKYTKKYRHFKYKEKNMCRNVTRYIERMVSNERKYQKNSERKFDPEREEVEIVIDEKSPKTSRIKIVNDRSSVSVVCHSLRRIVSPNKRKNNTAANRAEYSGGESSGYKSLQNSKTQHFYFVDRIAVESIVERESRQSDKLTSHNHHRVHVPPCNPFTSYESADNFIGKADITSARNSSDHLHEENLKTEQNPRVEKYGKQSTDIKFSPSDTNKYLSPFTNYMNVYLPSEITAYQLNKVNGNKTLQFNDGELLEKDIDDAELRIGKYLTTEQSDSEGESSDEKESTVQLGSVKGNVTIGDEMTVVKSSDIVRYKSSEMVVNRRFLELNNARAQTDSTDIPAAPAQLKIVTSLVDTKSVESTSESSSISINVSDVKLETKVDNPTPKLNSIEPHRTETVSKDAHTKPTSRGISCLKKFKNKREKPNDKNTVHELWANRKSIVDSTDNESQTSVKSRFAKRDSNKLKLNILKKLSASSNKKTINVSPDQLSKPPPTFLESSVPSQSTVLSATADTESFESEDFSKSSVDITSILSKTPANEFRTHNTGAHQANETFTNASSNGKNNFTQFQANNPASVHHEDVRVQPGTSAAPPLNKKLFKGAQEPHAAIPPPASAVPPPYPFCCPMAPYMMQHWPNYQQPPPASRVPLPEENWKSNTGLSGSVPPPPGMIPIPWFSRMPQMNSNTLPTGGTDSANNLYTQPPPEWLMMPRGYAPCLPCSKTPELRLKKTDSSTNEEEEPLFETIESRQDEKKKTVSNKLFKIFRRKNKGEVDTVEKNERKGRNLQSPSELKQIQKARVEQNNKQIPDDRSIWESPDIAGIVTPEEIGRCFRRGFRADGLTLSGDDYLCTRAPSDTASGQEDVFNFSEHDTPLDFLLALGFSVDEATAAIRDDEVRRRFKAALTEARIWVPHIATTQGTLLYLLAMKAKPKVMRYFLQLVESIVNKRITNAVKLDAYLKILEMVEDGYVSFVTLFGKETGQEDEEDTVIVEKQRRRIFYTIYKYAEAEAEAVDRPLTKASVDLLHSLAARYRSAIGPHLRLLACYIGEGLLTKDVQLEAALIYLSRLNSADVRLADLEIYCGLPPSERRRQEHIAREQSPDKV